VGCLGLEITRRQRDPSQGDGGQRKGCPRPEPIIGECHTQAILANLPDEDNVSMSIDAHHHLWKYSAAEYGWISPEMSVIRRDFLPADLEPLMHHFGIEGTIAVQARQTLEETAWLLELAQKHQLMRGVVGWVPFVEGDGVKRHLERFAANRKLRGMRHVIQDEADPRYILRGDFNQGIRALRDFKLRYDILIFEKHLPAAI